MTTGFHAKNGWYFERMSDGYVQIKYVPTKGKLLGVTFDPDTWASIVASVSVVGEDAETLAAARRFHGDETRDA